MLIKKNSGKAETPKNAVSANANYEKCLKYIKSAIDVLGETAKQDSRARDAIANLSVVYFDLK